MENASIKILIDNKPTLKYEGFDLTSKIGDNCDLAHGRFYTRKNAKILNSNDTNINLTIFSEDRKFIASCDPLCYTNLDKIKNDTSKIIEKLRKEGKNRYSDVNAILYGGIAFDNSLEALNGCSLISAFEDTFEKEGINTSIITGKYKTNSKELLNNYVGNNKIVLWGDIFNKIGLTLESTSEQILKSLDKIFEYVKINKDVNVIIIDKLKSRKVF